MADTEWVVVELGPKAEGEDPDLVRASIRHSIRDAEVFIPVSVTKRGEERVIKYLVDGYAFIKRTHPDQTYMRLENTKYVQSVLRNHVNVNGRSMRHVATVKEAEIDRLRGQMQEEVDQGISLGDKVLITSGSYKHIEAIVENEIAEHDSVQVHIKLRSVERIITLPRGFLRLLERAQRSPHRDRLNSVRSWFHRARPLMQWTGGLMDGVLVSYQTFVQLADFSHRDRLESTPRAPIPLSLLPVPPDFAPLVHQQNRVGQVRELRRRVRHNRYVTMTTEEFDRYMNGPEYRKRVAKFEEVSEFRRRVRHNRYVTMDGPEFDTYMGADKILKKTDDVERLSLGKSLDTALEIVYSVPLSPTLDERFIELTWLQTVVERLDALHEAIEAIEAAILSEDDVCMPQNLIIDGTQLAIRCLMSPGLSELKDKQGRSTGAIVGFCQSLAGLKKKYPTATIHVAWDSSNQRRKKMFAGYKASRSDRLPMASFEIHFLKNLLPLFGVHQAYNPYEEADDVIATLVRKQFKGQENAFLSTDRDLLQLVSPTDKQFVPAVGAGKEKVFTVESVVEEYGVEPGRLVQVRALAGDTSDDIPGADGIGLKTASKLVKVYGTLDRLLSSNFAGLTKKQTDSIRAAETQVRLNLELMQLQDDLDLTLVGPHPDQIAATERLREVDVKPESLLAAFFPDASGQSAQV